jgi:hypothetical protein
MTAITAAMRAHLDKARAFDPRPAVIALWNEIERLADAADDPAGALLACCKLVAAEAKLASAEQREEIERIAASLGAQIIEVDPALKPEGLAGVEATGWYQSEPTPCLYFPADRPSWERLDAARKIADSLVTA